MNQTESIFSELGGLFCTPAEKIGERLKTIKAFVFDWDGVFNDASKNENKSSTFNEADSMGTNLLRFSYFMKNHSLPVTAIISGEKNEMAFYFSQREHFSASYFKIPHKIQALEHFCTQHKLALTEVCFVFDDVLDLSVAEKCGLRILVNRRANPLFKNYIIKNNLTDYITAHQSGQFAVREACEMLMGLHGTYDEILKQRTEYSDLYATYITKRQSSITDFFTLVDGNIKSSPAIDSFAN